MTPQDTAVPALTAALDLRRYVGRWTLRAATHTGRFSIFLVDMGRALTEWRIYVPRTMEQAVSIVYGSLFLVLPSPAVAVRGTALQTVYPFPREVPLYL